LRRLAITISATILCGALAGTAGASGTCQTCLAQRLHVSHMTATGGSVEVVFGSEADYQVRLRGPILCKGKKCPHPQEELIATGHATPDEMVTLHLEALASSSKYALCVERATGGLEEQEAHAATAKFKTKR
jgi:hypothetical protein